MSPRANPVWWQELARLMPTGQPSTVQAPPAVQAAQAPLLIPAVQATQAPQIPAVQAAQAPPVSAVQAAQVPPARPFKFQH